MKVEVAVLGSHQILLESSGLCESRGGRPGLSVPNNPSGLCGRKATLNFNYILS